MIEFVRGAVSNLNPATVTIETNSGIAFLLNISVPTYTALEGVKEARLFVHESIREDAWTLYGFLDEEERELFRALVGVSGVGSSSARMILSTITVPELRTVIASGNSKRLKDVKGIGAKTAERIIVDLTDKIIADPDLVLEESSVQNPAFDEALEALVILGFQRQPSLKVLKKLFADDPTLNIEAAIKKAIKQL